MPPAPPSRGHLRPQVHSGGQRGGRITPGGAVHAGYDKVSIFVGLGENRAEVHSGPPGYARGVRGQLESHEVPAKQYIAFKQEEIEEGEPKAQSLKGMAPKDDGESGGGA